MSKKVWHTHLANRTTPTKIGAFSILQYIFKIEWEGKMNSDTSIKSLGI